MLILHLPAVIARCQPQIWTRGLSFTIRFIFHPQPQNREDAEVGCVRRNRSAARRQPFKWEWWWKGRFLSQRMDGHLSWLTTSSTAVFPALSCLLESAGRLESQLMVYIKPRYCSFGRQAWNHTSYTSFPSITGICPLPRARPNGLIIKVNRATGKRLLFRLWEVAALIVKFAFLMTSLPQSLVSLLFRR